LETPLLDTESYEGTRIALREKIENMATQIVKLNTSLIEYSQATQATNLAFSMKQQQDKMLLR
jgi:exonuclease VII small subunit